jgi:hypothetical protein
MFRYRVTRGPKWPKRRWGYFTTTARESQRWGRVGCGRDANTRNHRVDRAVAVGSRSARRAARCRRDSASPLRCADATRRERALDRALEPPRRWRAVRLNPSDGVGPALEANLRRGRSGMPEVSRAPAAHRCHRRPDCRAVDPAEPRHADWCPGCRASARPNRSIRARADRAIRSVGPGAANRGVEVGVRLCKGSLWSACYAISEHSEHSAVSEKSPRDRITLSLPPIRASSTSSYAPRRTAASSAAMGLHPGSSRACSTRPAASIPSRRMRARSGPRNSSEAAYARQSAVGTGVPCT